MNIAFQNKRNYYIIYINKLIHLTIKKSDFVGLQSYQEPATPQERSERRFGSMKYTIVYYLRTTSITCDYDRIEKWQTILNLINQHIK